MLYEHSLHSRRSALCRQRHFERCYHRFRAIQTAPSSAPPPISQTPSDRLRRAGGRLMAIWDRASASPENAILVAGTAGVLLTLSVLIELCRISGFTRPVAAFIYAIQAVITVLVVRKRMTAKQLQRDADRAGQLAAALRRGACDSRKQRSTARPERQAALF